MSVLKCYFSSQLYTFGCNDEGALGRDTTEEGSETVPAKVTLEQKVVQVSAGDSHTAALTEDGTVYIWGSFRVSSLMISALHTSAWKHFYAFFLGIFF